MQTSQLSFFFSESVIYFTFSELTYFSDNKFSNTIYTKRVVSTKETTLDNSPTTLLIESL